MLNDPQVTIVLKDFDKPYFIAAGEVSRPGKYDLRGDTTVTEAVAMAGGFNSQARHSQVVLFRRMSDELVETRLIDVKRMMSVRNLNEDMHLKPGDLLFVPQNTISKLRKYLPHVGHVQIAGVPERNEPDTGEINYTYLFQLLDELGYDGWLGCEYRPAKGTVEGLGWLRSLGNA